MEKQKDNKGGAPRKITFEDLKKALDEYARKNLGGGFEISEIAEKTGIKRYYWYYKENAKIFEYIDKLKYSPLIFDRENEEFLDIPSAESIVDANYKNRNRLIAAVGNIIEMYQRSFEEALEGKKALKQNKRLMNENEALNAKIRAMKAQVTYYKNLYQQVCIYSNSEIKREALGIKENVLEFRLKDAKCSFDSLVKDDVDIEKLEKEYDDAGLDKELKAKKLTERFPDLFDED